MSLTNVREDIDIPQKFKNRSTQKPRVPLLSVYSKEMKTEIQWNICTPMFIATLHTIPNQAKTRMPINGWVDNKYIYIMGYYPSMRRETILTFATTWTDLEHIMLDNVPWTYNARQCKAERKSKKVKPVKKIESETLVTMGGKIRLTVFKGPNL